jgi:hypothetical protein
MTADALSAAEAGRVPRSAAANGPSPAVPDGDAAELTEARQSVVDRVAARLGQVADGSPPGGSAADGAAGTTGAPPGDAPADGAPADGAPADGAPADGAPAGGAPAGGAPAGGAPAGGVRAGGAGTAAGGGPRANGTTVDGAPPVARPRPAPDDAPDDAPETAPADGGAADRSAATRAAAGDTAGEPGADVVGEVQAILERPTGDGTRFAATAVLDVLRASGWADADEARQLRAEADRLRELLDLVVRDHRAREASAAGLESQQHYWLLPLLRAAHGVAFGSLGAKVALRTAVQDVPEHILASAGLRIDHGVEPATEAYEER